MVELEWKARLKWRKQEQEMEHAIWAEEEGIGQITKLV